MDVQPAALSSQAVAVLLVGAAWTADVASRLLTGRYLIGGTAYMWDPQWPLFTRLLSVYHVALPPLLVFALRRIGYDPRGYLLQSGIVVAAVTAGRFFGPVANINYAYVRAALRAHLGRSGDPGRGGLRLPGAPRLPAGAPAAAQALPEGCG